MSISKVAVSDNHTNLMIAVGEAIRAHTAKSPMREEDIIGVLGFTLGCAIARASKSRNDRRQFREMAVANVDSGLDAMVKDMTRPRFIVPEGMQ